MKTHLWAINKELCYILNMHESSSFACDCKITAFFAHMQIIYDFLFILYLKR